MANRKGVEEGHREQRRGVPAEKRRKDERAHEEDSWSRDDVGGGFARGAAGGGDWQSTQTVWPENVGAGNGTGCSVTVSWDPVGYLVDPGGYRFEVAPANTGPWEEVGVFVPSKTTTSVTVTGLDPGTTYWFRVRSYTLPHGNNQNTVFSVPSAGVSATTASSGGGVDGDVNADTAVDTADLGALLGYFFGPTPAQRPDVDCDGRVNAADVMDLLDLL